MNPWRMVALLSFTATASYLCRVNVSVAGVQMMKEFGLTQAAMGRVFSAFLLGYALFQIPGGMLADRFGARRVLAVSALLWVAVTVWMAGVTAGQVALLLGLRFLLGFAEAPTFPASAQAISGTFEASKQGRANGFVVAAIGLGSAIAPPLLTFVMVRSGWRAALLVSAVPALGAGLGWCFLFRERIWAAGKPVSDGRGGRLGSRSFVLLTLSYTLQGYVGYIFVFWFYLYLVEVRHFDLLRGAVWGSLPWVLSIAAIPMGGWISDRLGGLMGRRAVAAAGLCGGAVCLAVGAHTASAVAAAVCLAVSTALVLSTEAPFWATMMEIAGSRSGAGGGMMNMGSNVGGLISPALTPVLAEWFGWENALYWAAALSAVGGLLWLGIRPKDVSCGNMHS